jgi:hypothetical protein
VKSPRRPPLGLRLFPAATPRRLRRAKIGFAALALLAGAAVSWPIYPRFAAARPFVLGLPLSLAWVVAWLAVVFAGLVALFAVEHGGPRDRSAGP